MTYPPYPAPTDPPSYDPGYPTTWAAPAAAWGPVAWGPASAGTTPAPAPAARPWLLPALVGAGGLVAGLLLATLLMTVVYTSAAEDIGRGVAEGFADGMAESMQGFTGGYPGFPSEEQVEQTEPVPPGDLGADPVLDRYAEDCFDGDLTACDDLFYVSPPLSPYEEYGGTCGGRVKVYTVASCTELE
jgi:hypothetical protein